MSLEVVALTAELEIEKLIRQPKYCALQDAYFELQFHQTRLRGSEQKMIVSYKTLDAAGIKVGGLRELDSWQYAQLHLRLAGRKLDESTTASLEEQMTPEDVVLSSLRCSDVTRTDFIPVYKIASKGVKNLSCVDVSITGNMYYGVTFERGQGHGGFYLNITEQDYKLLKSAPVRDLLIFTTSIQLKE